MKAFLVRNRTAGIGLAGAMTLLAACEDKRVSQLDTGITRDSAVSVLAQKVTGTGHDPFPNVYTKEQYLIAGRTYEVLFFSPTNKKLTTDANLRKTTKDTLAWKDLTPLIFVDNKLVAKGWPAWDSVSTANHIPVKKR
jgi:hypothetical protein